MTHSEERYDLIGIGFGPANLSVAIALEETLSADNPMRSCFIERKPAFEWHGNMLLDGTRMQISYMKDLATLRNPTSTFSFTNYLFTQGRLNAFINMGTSQPTRVEFNDYLQWAASRIKTKVHYGNEVSAVEPVIDENNVEWVRISSTDVQGNVTTRLARNIIIAPGGLPKLPHAFNAIEDVKSIPSLTHSSRYKTWRNEFARKISNPRIGIIGAGQSAAEIFVDLVNDHPDGEIEIINRERSIHPADDSPFVNEVFDPSFTTEMYQSSEQTRQHLLQRFQSTNYAVVDMPEINSIYETLYTQRITGKGAHKHRSAHEIKKVKLNNDQSWTLTMRDGVNDEEKSWCYDGIVLATGYQYTHHFTLLNQLDQWRNTVHPVERNYRMPMQNNFKVNIYLQGCNESSHGLSDTLLSVMAVRAKEIVTDLFDKVFESQQVSA
jgi:L-ornithine N5-oxygenase